MKLTTILGALALATSSLTAWAAEPQTTAAPASVAGEPSSAVVMIRMKDGSSLRARVIDRNDDRLKVVTLGGLAMDIPRSEITSMTGDASDDGPRPSDSNYTRLLFSPTGRPLGKGEGYFSDHYVVFPGFAYGITDNLSVGGGVSVIPGVGLDEQVFYVSPRLGKQLSDRFALSAGVLWAHAGDGNIDGDGDLGVGFAMATVGRPDKSLTVGLGVTRTVHQENYRYVNGRNLYDPHREVSHTPVVVFGGTARISRRLAFVSENWLILHDDFKLSQQPFGVGLRFLGDKLSADVGVILVGELIDEGFPLPWLSVTYHFGPKR